MPPPPSRILENLKQVHFNRVSWDNSGSANPTTTRPVRSRFASEDRIGEAQFFPAGSPTPPREMSRRSDEYGPYGHQPYATGHTVEEPDSYLDPVPPAPAKKKSRWKKIFSRKGKGKGKEKASTYDERPLPPPPLSSGSDSLAEPPLLVIPPPAHAPPPSDISTSRRYELRDPGFISPSRSVPRRMSVTQSRDESLRSAPRGIGSARGSDAVYGAAVVQEGSIFGDRNAVRDGSVRREESIVQEGSVFGPRYEHRRYEHSQESGSVFDAGPTPMLVDEKSGNRIEREVSYASQTGSHQLSAQGVPIKKKKRSLGGTLKHLFGRKKKRTPVAEHQVEVVVPARSPPRSHFVEEPPVIQLDSPARPPVVVEVPASASAPTPVVIDVRASSSRASGSATHRSGGPPAFSPRSSRSSRSHRSVTSPMPQVVVPISPRGSIPISPRQSVPISPRQSAPVSTHQSVAVPISVSPQTVPIQAPSRRPPAASLASVARPPQRYPTGSSYGGGGQRRYGSGLGRRGTGSTTGGRAVPVAAPVIVPAAPLTRVSGSESPSIHSIDKSWGEVHVPPEPEPYRPAPRANLGLGLGTGGLGLRTRPSVSRTTPARRTYTAPPARTPYVHVPRPIPPPPRYPTLPTVPAASGAGAGAGALDAQVQMIVTALRDLAAEDRHRRVVEEARLQEERAYTEAERAREAELRALVVRLAASRVGGGIGEFGTREPMRPTGYGATGGLESARTTPEGERIGAGGLRTTAITGLGVGGADIERLLEIMRQGHEVTMQTYRDMIERWRKDIDVKHHEFLAEQAMRREQRERRREKPIRWQPGVNMW